MPHLTTAQREAALAALDRAGRPLAALRAALLAELPPEVAAHLDHLPEPRAQLAADLEALDHLPAPAGAPSAIALWLRAAAAQAPQEARLLGALAAAPFTDDPRPYTPPTDLPPVSTGSRPLSGPTDPALTPAGGHFVGREALVDAVLADLRAGRSVHLVAPPGGGASEVARAALRTRLCAPGPGVRRVMLEGATDLVELAVAVGEAAGDPRAVSPEAALAAASRAPGLFWLEGLTDVVGAPGALPFLKRLADLPRVQLLTTAAAAPDLGGVVHAVPPLADAAAADLLAELWAEAGGAPDARAALGPLAERAEGNPLALVLLAALARGGPPEEARARVDRAGHDPATLEPALGRALHAALAQLGRDRRPRLLLTLAALCPGGLGPRVQSHLEEHRVTRPADRQALVRAHLARLEGDRLVVPAALGRFALHQAQAERGGFSARRARAALGACVAPWTELEKAPLDRADLLAVHRLLRFGARGDAGPWDVAQTGVALLRCRAPLLARASLRAALADPSPLVRLDAARALVALAGELGEPLEAQAAADTLATVAAEVGDPLSGLLAALARTERALEAADPAAVAAAWSQARALAAHDAGVLWRTTADALRVAAARGARWWARIVGLAARAWAAPLRRALSAEAQWRWIARPLGLSAALALRLGEADPRDAERLALVEAHPGLRDDPATQVQLARLRAAAGDRRGAYDRCRAALTRARALDHPLALANGLVVAAALRQAADDPQSARAMLAEAIWAYGRVGHRAGAARAAALLAAVPLAPARERDAAS